MDPGAVCNIIRVPAAVLHAVRMYVVVCVYASVSTSRYKTTGKGSSNRGAE